MRILTYLAARWFEVRAARALAAHVRLKKRAEKYFRRVGLGGGT